MSAAQGVLAVIVAALAAYAVLGGADFGAGMWYGLAPRRHRAASRRLVLHAMGPVWEANHTWLVFVLIGLFSGFPAVFAAYSQALFLPMAVALTAIVLRGAAFAFLSAGAAGPWGGVFTVSSLLAPFPFGVAAGALATGGLSGQGQPTLAPLMTPTATAAGLLAVAIAAYLGAVFLCRHAATDAPHLVPGLQRRAVWSSVGVLAAAAAAPILLAQADPDLATGMAQRSLAAAVVASAAIAATGYLIGVERFAAARLTASMVALCVLAAGAAMLYPRFGVGDLTVHTAAAPGAHMRVTLVILATGFAVVVPAMVLLFRIFRPRGPGDVRGVGRLGARARP